MNHLTIVKTVISQKENDKIELNLIREFKWFQQTKERLNEDIKKLVGFYNLNQSAVNSEFGLLELKAYFEKNYTFLKKHDEEYKSKLKTTNMEDKINQIIGFDSSKIVFSSKNFLPRNISQIYQPIDRSNELQFFNAENEKFYKVSISLSELTGFNFLPFSRYINFNGRLVVIGGYESTNKLSRTVWLVEEKQNSSDSNRINKEGNSKKKFDNINLILDSFYSNVNEKYIYDDQHLNFRVIKCSDMIYGRAGHSLVCFPPSLIFALGGSENNRSCELFHFETNKWEEIAKLNFSRIDASSCIYKNYLYVFFGFNYDKTTRKFNFLETIERIPLLNTQNQQWEMFTPRKSNKIGDGVLPRSLCGLVIKGKKDSSSIYLCGGQVEKGRYSDEIFEFDFERQTMNFVEHQRLPRPTAFLEQNFIYMFKTGLVYDIYGDVFFYHTESDTFTFQFQKEYSDV